MILTKDPDKRPNITEVFNHPLLQSKAHDRVPDVPIARDSLEKLSAFNAKSKLQRATMTYIVSQLVSGDEISHLRDVFQNMDENGDGKLSKEELKKGCERYKGTIEMDVDRMMDEIDTDYNGYIDYTEFLTAAIN